MEMTGHEADEEFNEEFEKLKKKIKLESLKLKVMHEVEYESSS